jgi:peptidoglycan hydrolase FlgJ
MTIAPLSPTRADPTDTHDRTLAKAARDMESLFVQQLYKAMRDTVPAEGGLVERTQGEDLFSGLMDERIAADTGSRWHRGLSDAISAALGRLSHPRS